MRVGRTGHRLLLAGALALIAPHRVAAQFGLTDLPLTDFAYDQLAALEHMGCGAARVSTFRPYQVRAIRAALIRAHTRAHCAGPILDALSSRFLVRTGRDTSSGLRAGASATLQATALSRGDYLPLWDNILTKGQGTPPIVGIGHVRLEYGDGADDHYVIVADGYGETSARNDPTAAARHFRSTSGVIDVSEAYATARAGPFTFSLGRADEAWLGEGTESIVLSANGPPLNRLAVEFHTAHFEGRMILGMLDDVVLSAQQDSFSSTIQPQRYYRYLLGHAVTWRPAPVLDVTIGETALLSRGSQVLDLYYINPFIPYILTQNDSGKTGDDARDNLQTFAGLTLRPGPVTVSAELLIDDIQIDASSRKRTPDQLGWQLAAAVPLPTRWPASITALYERIDGYTYMRQYYTEVSQYYNVPLGSMLGPDADYVRLGGEVFVAGPFRIAGGVGYWRHGDNRIFDRPGREATGNANATFPTSALGPVQTAALGDLSIQYLNRFLPIKLQVNAADIRNANNIASPAALYTQTQLTATYAFHYP